MKPGPGTPDSKLFLLHLLVLSQRQFCPQGTLVMSKDKDATKYLQCTGQPTSANKELPTKRSTAKAALQGCMRAQDSWAQRSMTPTRHHRACAWVIWGLLSCSSDATLFVQGWTQNQKTHPDTHVHGFLALLLLPPGAGGSRGAGRGALLPLGWRGCRFRGPRCIFRVALAPNSCVFLSHSMSILSLLSSLSWRFSASPQRDFEDS